MACTREATGACLATSNQNGRLVIFSSRDTHSCLPAAGKFNQVGTLSYIPSMGTTLFRVALLEWTEQGPGVGHQPDADLASRRSRLAWLASPGISGPR